MSNEMLNALGEALGTVISEVRAGGGITQPVYERLIPSRRKALAYDRLESGRRPRSGAQPLPGSWPCATASWDGRRHCERRTSPVGISAFVVAIEVSILERIEAMMTVNFNIEELTNALEIKSLGRPAIMHYAMTTGN